LKRLVENFFTCTIKSIQIDGGGEFILLQRLLAYCGISYWQTCPHTHHQNGSVERRHRQIMDIGLALLAHSNVPFKHWDDKFETACFLINHLPTLTRLTFTFDVSFHKILDYRFLKTFGYECWPYFRPYNSHKFSYCSKSCLFLGYSKSHHGYKWVD
jgi:capsular polysaccharide biosynthesis protein